MIREIQLKNWKSFRDARLYFDPLVVLIGMNASGKSNAIDAIDFLSRIAQSKDLAECLQTTSNGDSFRGGTEWVTLRGESNFHLLVVVKAKDGDASDYRYEIVVRPAPKPVVISESLHRIKRTKRAAREYSTKLFWTEQCSDSEPAITARLYNSRNGTPRQMLRGLPVLTQLHLSSTSIKSQDILSGLEAVWNALTRLFILNPIPSHMRSFSPKSEKLSQDGSNLAGVIAALPEKRKAEVEEAIRNYASKLPERDILSLKADLYGPFKSDAMLICDEGWKDGHPPLKVDSRAMSDGTLRFVAIITALLTLPTGTQLVIEEVDNGLHPSRSNLLLQMIREIGDSRKIDVLVSTHNPALLDALGPEMIPFVMVAHRDPEEGDSRLTLLEDIARLPKLMASGTLGVIASSGALQNALNSEALVRVPQGHTETGFLPGLEMNPGTPSLNEG
jgi:predicted ATPase